MALLHLLSANSWLMDVVLRLRAVSGAPVASLTASHRVSCCSSHLLQRLKRCSLVWAGPGWPGLASHHQQLSVSLILNRSRYGPIRACPIFS